MSPLFLVRLILDCLAAILLLIALAYNWLGNTAHEIIGTVMFGLLVTHVAFNRRWLAGLKKVSREPRWLLTRTINLSLLLAMLVLLVTSVIISQTVFGFLDLTSTFTVRQIHSLVGYLVLLIASIHLGLQWTMVMKLTRDRLGLSSHPTRTLALRVLTFGIASYGIYSLVAVNIGAKLTMTTTMDLWDFETAALAFFMHLAAILGLGASIGHYLLKILRFLGSNDRSKL
ncbi:DUF4405 domain-containing protein [Agrobacterium rubi]|uniref:DUF4405 domain-containing protein n=1 Tax=Agrobacterium rubi TaxID=28099 RepID=A0AAE7RAR8_9HYPH|nr:DUF4405 domain-containing protein [Agrobacterium rubi]NTE88348.1 DUF4405 domain-containing protein [Agrobacterium rubi]NTF04114.1 DUF4405 domain-containing protein [Agrobacterium rubi]NTF09528.1 DUF4405 domain-containing protein [Agrobacterium rubi]NTF22435.1 DUF4405 domain-containing protein [Agrobacterium rubi]NTF29292.1 DUF4405 domain-containing protein [Agrobacterium rubi]